MDHSTPNATMDTLAAARRNGDVAGAVACYEPTATVVLEPGEIAVGVAAIKAFTEATIPLPMTFSARVIVEAGDLALHICEWTITAAGGVERMSDIKGRTTDVLRRQSDGTWLLAIDNPWGTGILVADA